MLGRTLAAELGDEFDVVPTDLPEADVTDENAIDAVIARHRPDVVVHCAAMTAVDRCETERELAFRLPAGEEYLQTLILAMRSNRRVIIEYKRFGAESKERTVSPYALKLFHRRWYLLAYTGRHIATFSLDRIQSVVLTEETFEMPADFSPQQYFSEYFGVTTDETPLAHVVIRASGWAPDYLNTLPLHHSQREIAHQENYTDYSLDIRPTPDFIGELISYGDSIKVLEPADLRLKICEILKKTLNEY